MKIIPYSLLSALILAIVSRLVIIFTAVLGSHFLPIINPNAWDTGLPVLNLFARWDAGHYFRIAEKGYDDVTAGFFPLYPLLIKLLSSPLILYMPKLWAMNMAGFILSNFFFFTAVVGLYRLTYIVFRNNKIAFGSCLFFSFWPSSVFLSAVYAESLTLALTLHAFVMLERERYLVGSLLAFLAALSRPIGFVAFIPFLIKAIKRRSLVTFGSAVLPLSSIILFDVYRYTVVSRFDLASIFQPLLTITNTRPFLIFTDVITQTQFNPALKILSLPLFSLMFLSFIYVMLTKEGITYSAYSAALMTIYLFFASIQGLPRYSLMVITIYWMLGHVWSRTQSIGIACLTGSATLMGLLTIVFANWYELP
ncbi:MAG: mannosyltransferase family protein [Candidatus Caldarchaeum sp.]